MSMQDSWKVLGVAALIVIAGISSVELSRQPAHAEVGLIAGGAAGYAGERVDGAFQVAAAMPTLVLARAPVAAKGDLPPIGCRGPLRAEVADECMDAVEEPAAITETRVGDATSVLSRVVSYQLAGF